MALPTKGRVIIDTTVGEIDIELWSKACPRHPSHFWPHGQAFSHAVVASQARLTPFHYLQETPKACRNFIALAMEGL